MQKFSIIFLAAAFMLFSSCKNGNKEKSPTADVKAENNTAHSQNSNQYLIASHCMGGVKTGMSKAGVLNLYPKSKEGTIQLEAEIPCLSILDTDGSLLFSAGYEADSITILETHNVKMKTAAGIQVGSSYTALKTAYPDLVVANIEGYTGFSTKEKISFSLAGDIKLAIVNEETMETKFISASPDTKATMILVE